MRGRELLMLDRRAQYRYGDALDAVAPLLQNARAKTPQLDDIRNRAQLLRVIADVPPQRVSPGERAPVAIDAGGRVPIAINGRVLGMQLDTGANFSAMPRRTALMLGLPIRRTGYIIGSSMGGRVTADVAVADLSFPDGTRVQNAIFLVLPDSALPVQGLIGFPVLAALGSVSYSGRDVTFGESGQGSSQEPLALSGNDLLLRVSYDGKNLLCRLDTGADRTIFYEPFYRRYGQQIAAARGPSVRIGSATGSHRLGTLPVSSFRIAIAGKSFVLGNAAMLTKPVSNAPNRGLFCNIGRDVLRNARDYRIDFAKMTLSFGP
ncbi:MAG: retropepsin-like aspartic protease [Rhizomicrobium sp.]